MTQDPEPAEDLTPTSSESHVSLLFQHFLLTEMPRLFTRTAEEHAGRHIQAHEALPMEAIPKIIEESLQKAFRTWEARGSEVPTREASVASMSFLPDPPPTTLPYGFDHHQSTTGYQTPLISAGMDHGFPHHQALAPTTAGFTPDLPHATHADDSGFVEGGGYYVSEPPAGFNTLATNNNGDWETGMGMMGVDHGFGNQIGMGGGFRGFRNGY